ncbi:MAG: hypothetical protein LBN05_00320 [Oscillospiraceae bacterium]|jgi:electron transport complex protein RnfE|nr:hypothetical protein [Oscillospiraceae bacterium]
MAETTSFRERLQKSALARNPVLIQMLAICTAMASVDLKTAAVLCGAFLLIFFVTQSAANLFMTGWRRYYRVGVYALIGGGLASGVVALLAWIDPALLSGATMYVGLLSVSGVTVLHCEKCAVNVTLRESLEEAAVTGIGYCGVLLLVGFLRELLATGAVLGLTVFPHLRLAFFALPAGALLVVGFLAALLRIVVHQYAQNFTQELKMKISDTTVTAAIPVEREIEVPLDPRAAYLSPDAVGLPLAFTPQSALDEQTPPPEADAPPAEEDAQGEEISALPAALEDTQESFEALMAELRRKYLDN